MEKLEAEMIVIRSAEVLGETQAGITLPFERGRKTSDKRAPHARRAEKHFGEEKEVPTSRPWGRGQKRSRGMFEDLLIAGPAHGSFTSSLRTIVTGSCLAPGFLKLPASSPASTLCIVETKGSAACIIVLLYECDL